MFSQLLDREEIHRADYQSTKSRILTSSYHVPPKEYGALSTTRGNSCQGKVSSSQDRMLVAPTRLLRRDAIPSGTTLE